MNMTHTAAIADSYQPSSAVHSEHYRNLSAAFDALGIGVSHFFGGGVYAKQTVIPAGVELLQHSHAFDHLSILATGSVVVRVNGESTPYVGPACIVIKAGIPHAVKATTNAVWYCIHATDETEPEAADASLIEGVT